MPTENKLKTDAKEAHDNLSEDYYKNSLMSKEDFDYYHGEIWNGLEQAQIDADYRTVPEPPLDLEAELDELKLRLSNLESK